MESLLTLAERHYSYECKAAPQERPYIARPSRTQQLFNPKLLPKLSNETPNALLDKKGAADEVLATREAERSRKREREGEGEGDAALRESPPPRRRRSPSFDSVSSISTRSPSPPPRRSPSPPRRTRPRHTRSPSPRRSYDSGDRYSRDPSVSPERSSRARDSRPPRSPSPRRPSSRGSAARDGGDHRHERPYGSPRPSRYSAEPHARRAYSRSQSPVERVDRGDRHGAGRYRDRDDLGRRPRGSTPPPPQQPSPPRARSLSPFSKRLALTQAMNRGG